MIDKALADLTLSQMPKIGNMSPHRCVNGNLFVYVGDNAHPFNIFDFRQNQSAQGIHEFLKNYSGYLQCDAHGNYKALFRPKVPDS